MIHIILALGFVAGSLAHPPPLCADDPVCPNIPTVANFNKRRFKDVWYELARSKDVREDTLKCVTVRYTPIGDNDDLQMIDRAINKNTGLRETAKAMEIAPTEQTEASKFSIKFVNVDGEPTRTNWILDTDYKTFAIIYSCDPTSGRNSAWLLTRKPNPDEQEVSKLMEAAREHSVNTSLLVMTDHTDCGYHARRTGFVRRH